MQCRELAPTLLMPAPMPRSFATFRYQDRLDGGDGALVTQALRKLFPDCLFRRQDEILNEDLEWEIYAKVGRTQFIINLQVSDAWLVSIVHQRSFRQGARAADTETDWLEVVKWIHEGLSADERFSDLRWWSKHEFEAGGRGAMAPTAAPTPG